MTTKTTSVAIVLEKLLNEIASRMHPAPAKVIYDPAMSLTSALANLRRIETQESEDDLTDPLGDKSSISDDLPLLMWSRTPLKRDSQLGMRAINNARLTSGSDPKIVNALLGEFELSLMLVTANMEDIEIFEVEFYTSLGIDNIQEISCNLDLSGEVVQQPYYLSWSELESLDNEIEDSVYASVTFSVVVRGNFYSLRDSTKAIVNINTTYI